MPPMTTKGPLVAKQTIFRGACAIRLKIALSQAWCTSFSLMLIGKSWSDRKVNPAHVTDADSDKTAGGKEKSQSAPGPDTILSVVSKEWSDNLRNLPIVQPGRVGRRSYPYFWDDRIDGET